MGVDGTGDFCHIRVCSEEDVVFKEKSGGGGGGGESGKPRNWSN